MFGLKLKTLIYFNQRKLKASAEKSSSIVKDSSFTGVLFSSVLKLISLCFFGVIILFPFFLMISLSLFNDIESQNLANEFKLIPSFSKGPSFKNGALQDLPWKEVVQNTYTRAFSTGYWNSLIITFLNVLVSVVLKVIVTMLMGYAFSLKNWRGKNVIWFFALALLVLPEIALLSGQLQVVFRLKLNATYFGFVLTIALPFVASVFNAIMYKTAFEAIPDRIKEVALVDGAVGYKYFLKIAAPMVLPTTLTVVILTALAAWNAYLWPSLTSTGSTKDFQVLSVWLFKAGIDPDVQDSSANIQQNVKMAASIIAILPMFLVYLLFRKRIMAAISRQGSTIKGSYEKIQIKSYSLIINCHLFTYYDNSAFINDCYYWKYSSFSSPGRARYHHYQ